jgi:hypothetical protein
MNKSAIGWLFIAAGFFYGSFAFDFISARTLGWLVKNDWVKAPENKEIKRMTPLGPRSAIIFFSIALILIGMFILWNRNA